MEIFLPIVSPDFKAKINQMKIFRGTLILIISILLSTSCKVHEGLTRNENQHQTQIVLSEKNYRIVKYVEGDAYARYYFGIGGGSSKRGLVARARENMLKNAGLIGKSRAVINETVENQYKQTFFVTDVRYIVSAYVIEFYDPATENAPLAEENVYTEPDAPSPTEVTKGITAGITSNSLGFHAGYMWEFSKPDIKHLFWSTQLNLSNLNTIFDYGNNTQLENNLAIEIPFLLGVKFPIGKKNQWFIKGGPTIGVLLDLGRLYYGPIPSIGGELYSGFQFGKHWQASLGHRWNIGFYEYDYTKISLNYLF